MKFSYPLKIGIGFIGFWNLQTVAIPPIPIVMGMRSPFWMWIILALLVIALLVMFVLLYRTKLNNLYLIRKSQVQDDDLFRKLYNKSPIMMHSIDMDGNLVYVNDYWLKMLGYDRSEVIGRKSEYFFTGEIKENYKKIFRQLLDDGKIRDFQARMKKQSGEEIEVLLTAELAHDQRGVPTHAYTILMDISERVRAEKLLLEGKHKLNSILNNAVEAIFVLQDFRIQYANPATVDILGYTLEDLEQFPFQKILFDDDKEWILNNYERRMRQEDVPQKYSFRVKRKDETVIWIEINAVYLKWDEKPAILVFLVDITERKTQEEQLREQAEELKKTNEQQAEMNKKLQDKNKALDEHQVELQEYADELKAVLEEVAIKNERIERAHRDMMDSIEYAKLIQEAILQTSYELEGVFDHFVFYKPKDIVSGDFFFFKKFKDVYLFAVADCTGHGVPGGFLTMLGINLLQEVVTKNNVKEPDVVLEILREKVKHVFKHSRHHDGMDIALAAYDRKEFTLHYAGANMNAIIIDNNEETILKPVHNPIGYYVQENQFEKQCIQISGSETLYLYSDGFKDQFGGEKGRKYQFRRFKEFLLANYKAPMSTQKELIDQEYKQWKGSQPQLDDITVMGVKLN